MRITVEMAKIDDPYKEVLHFSPDWTTKMDGDPGVMIREAKRGGHYIEIRLTETTEDEKRQGSQVYRQRRATLELTVKELEWILRRTIEGKAMVLPGMSELKECQNLLQKATAKMEMTESGEKS